MAWRAASFDVEGQNVEALADALLTAGAIFVDVADAWAATENEQTMFDVSGAVSETAWEKSRLVVVFDIDVDVAVCLTGVFEALGYGSTPCFTLTEISQQDWVRHSKEQFLPIKIGERLWVVPTWHTPPDANAINLIIDPGLAFGTGGHATTCLCLQWLEQHIRGDEAVLDYGCGSGILAIAATKLGAFAAVGVDIDMEALSVSRRNAVQNKAQARFYAPDELPRQEFDIVISNILANPLKMLAPVLAAYAKPGAKIVLSGLLMNQEQDIRDVYRTYVEFNQKLELDGWICLSGTRC